jgi:hypothetical protein
MTAGFLQRAAVSFGVAGSRADRRQRRGRFTSVGVAPALVLMTCAAFADAELDESARVGLEAVPRSLYAAVAAGCREGGGLDIPQDQWSVYRHRLPDGALLFFVQCRSAASNDLFKAASITRAGRVAVLQVYSPIWDQKRLTIIDRSGGGAGCTELRVWRWGGEGFSKRSEKIRGC